MSVHTAACNTILDERLANGPARQARRVEKLLRKLAK